MSGITLVFPIVTLLFILLFFLGCPAPKTAELGSIGRSSFSRRDAIVLGLIVIIYSAVAFYNLGDTKAPQSFYRFEPNESVKLDLGREQAVSSLMLYTGLNTAATMISPMFLSIISTRSSATRTHRSSRSSSAGWTLFPQRKTSSLLSVLPSIPRQSARMSRST